MTETAGPSYQLVEDDIRARIMSGEYSIGSAVPSTRKLEEQYGVSDTVIKQAVGRLKRDGILRGQPGKAVYVLAMPGEAESKQATVEELTARVIELEREVADLRERVGRQAAQLATVAKKPRGGSREQSKAAADGGRR